MLDADAGLGADIGSDCDQTPAGLQMRLPGIVDRVVQAPRGANMANAIPPSGKLPMRRVVIACTPELRDAANAIAARSRQSLSRLVVAVLDILPDTGAQHFGLPPTANPGKPGRRGPRLILRVPAGNSEARVQQALALLVHVGGGTHALVPAAEVDLLLERLRQAEEKVGELTDSVERIAFRPLRGGVNSREEAMYVLGLPPSERLDAQRVSSRFRAVAPIFHPDTGVVASHMRMVQVIEARKLLMLEP